MRGLHPRRGLHVLPPSSAVAVISGTFRHWLGDGASVADVWSQRNDWEESCGRRRRRDRKRADRFIAQAPRLPVLSGKGFLRLLLPLVAYINIAARWRLTRGIPHDVRDMARDRGRIFRESFWRCGDELPVFRKRALYNFIPFRFSFSENGYFL